MSLGKEQMLKDAAAELKKERETCGCKFDWDDKFWELCDEHAERQQLEEVWKEAWQTKCKFAGGY